jgi:hypothetical protein
VALAPPASFVQISILSVKTKNYFVKIEDNELQITNDELRVEIVIGYLLYGIRMLGVKRYVLGGVGNGFPPSSRVLGAMEGHANRSGHL